MKINDILACIAGEKKWGDFPLDYFEGADLRGAYLWDANLEGADLRGADSGTEPRKG